MRHAVRQLFFDASGELVLRVAGMFGCGGLDQNDPAFLGRGRHVLDAAGHHVKVTLGEHNIGTVAIADHQLALAHQEELILLRMAMPDELALDFGDLDILAVGDGNDAR
jgi:hypothetical protein